MSHESVRIYYHRLKRIIKHPTKKKRRLIAIDETKIKLEKKQIFVWAAIDVIVKNAYLYGFLKEDLAFMLTYSRDS